MRIAFSGSHRCGKSTLIADLAGRLEGYGVVDEPYQLLEEDGYEFADPPSIDDFVEQLRCSLALLEEEAPNQLLDRCPVDFLGYLLVHPDSESFDPEDWIDEIRAAVQKLDLVVFVPIEELDRVRLSAHEDRKFREEVHEKLAWIVLDDPFELGVEVLPVHGRRAERVAQVLERVRRA